MNGKTSPRSHLPRIQSHRFQVTWAFSMALPGRPTAHPNQALEEEQKYSSRGSAQTARSASPAATGSTPWLKQDLNYSNYIMRH